VGRLLDVSDDFVEEFYNRSRSETTFVHWLSTILQPFFGEFTCELPRFAVNT
jgi:hypothetical protein